MKKSILLALAVSISALSTVSAYADHEKECEQAQVKIALYAGWASCSAYGKNGWHNISEFVSQSISPYISLTAWIGGSEYVSCSAVVPYAGYDVVTIDNCEAIQHAPGTSFCPSGEIVVNQACAEARCPATMPSPYRSMCLEDSYAECSECEEDSSPGGTSSGGTSCGAPSEAYCQ